MNNILVKFYWKIGTLELYLVSIALSVYYDKDYNEIASKLIKGDMNLINQIKQQCQQDTKLAILLVIASWIHDAVLSYILERIGRFLLRLKGSQEKIANILTSKVQARNSFVIFTVHTLFKQGLFFENLVQVVKLFPTEISLAISNILGYGKIYTYLMGITLAVPNVFETRFEYFAKHLTKYLQNKIDLLNDESFKGKVELFLEKAKSFIKSKFKQTVFPLHKLSKEDIPKIKEDIQTLNKFMRNTIIVKFSYRLASILFTVLRSKLQSNNKFILSLILYIVWYTLVLSLIQVLINRKGYSTLKQVMTKYKEM